MQWKAHNYNHLHEQPTLFYAVAVVLAIVGVYHLAASLIFPDEPEQWPDFDDWYDRQKRMVIGGLLLSRF